MNQLTIVGIAIPYTLKEGKIVKEMLYQALTALAMEKEVIRFIPSINVLILE